MLSFSNAKINLGLNVVEKRADGYHNIESVFYPIGWSDIIEVLPDHHFSLTTSGLPISGEEKDNLIVKAFHLLQPQHKSVKIYLHKILPMGAGLGGGSSNGAFALKSINAVLDLGWSDDALKRFANQLGSDCAFFIDNHPYFCSGTGSTFEPIELRLKNKFIVIVNPGIHISTLEAYSSIQPKKPKECIKEILQQPIEHWREHLKNDFEEPVIRKYSDLQNIKEILYHHGALYASMTGSGSTFYGIFTEEIDLKEIFKPYTYWSGYLE